MNKLSKGEIEKELIAITEQLLLESGGTYKAKVTLNVSFERLGIDSLTRAELFRRIEKAFSVDISDQLLAEAFALSDIANYLAQAHLTIKTSTKTSITSHQERTDVDPMNAKTLLEVLWLYGEQAPNKPHIFFQTEEGKQEIITYSQLLKSSLRVASGLRALGLREGETVAIMQPTHPNFFFSFYGTLLAGGIPVPIYPPFRMHMLEAYAKTESKILHNAEVRILVTFKQAENLSHLLKAFVPSLKHVTTVQELLVNEELANPFHAKSENFALIQYTSGSTSVPKGVLLNHLNLMSNIHGYGKAIQIQPEDVAVSWLPLYHDMGLIGMWLGSLFYGVPLILMTPFSFLNHPERWLWAIHHHRGTISGAPNFAYELCVRKIETPLLEGLDLSSWRIAANGAEKVYPSTLEEFAKKFAPFGFKPETLLPVYGLAESTVSLTIPRLGRKFHIDYIDRKKFEEMKICEPSTEKNALQFVSSGVPIEHHEIRIIDDHHQILPERHVGNLQFRGPSSMQGYYHNPKATDAVFHNGWIDTGDLAYIADQELFITGRRKDLIIKAGRNLYPAEIEELVGNVEGVRRGCVTAFGVADSARATEQLIVVAETREKNTERRKKISGDIQQTISDTLDIIPDQIFLVAPHTVPKTSSGKLQRGACKLMFMEGRLGKKQTPTWLQFTRLGWQWFVSKTLSTLKTIGRCIYTIYMVTIFALTLIPVYFIVRWTPRSFAALTCKYWARFLLLISLCPIKVIGKENLTKVSPVIYAVNHASYLDSVVMLALVPAGTRFVGKKELFTAPIFRTFMRKLDFIGVARADLSEGLEDAKQIERTLRNKESILIYPEGTFSYSLGLRPFRLGAFKMAGETQTPICPISLQGTRFVLRGNEKLMSPQHVKIIISEPIVPAGSEWKEIMQLRAAVRAEIAKHSDEPSLDFIAAQKVASSAR